MKIKIITAYTYEDLEEKVNVYLVEIEVMGNIDVINVTHSISVDSDDVYEHYATILYKEE